MLLGVSLCSEPIVAEVIPSNASFTAQPMLSEETKAAPTWPCPTLSVMSLFSETPTLVLTQILVNSLILYQIL